MIPKQLVAMRFNRVMFKEKRAFEKGWQNNPHTYEQIQKYFPKENYGVLCGKELRVLDDDSSDKRLVNLFVQNFGQTFKVRDHLYFKFDGGQDKKIVFNDYEDGHMGELQGEGTYVVGAGSTHPSGEIYERKNDLSIITISYDEFMKVFDKYTKAQIKSAGKSKVDVVYNSDDDVFIKGVKDKWKDGDREHLALSVAGYLRKSKRLGLLSSLAIVRKICEDCGDEEIESRLTAVRATYDRDEGKVLGITGLVAKDIDIGMKNEVLQLIATRRDDDATEMIVEFIEKNNNIYTTKDDIKAEVWYYDDGIYVPNGKSMIEYHTRKILGAAYSPYLVNKVVAKIRSDTQIDHDEFFKNDVIDEIPIRNGILNVLTKELIPFSPKRIFFNKMPITYDKSKDCPNIKKFFSDVLKDSDDATVMFELIGFCLLKDYRFEKSAMFIGGGRNGKGKTLSLIKHFLGIENCSSVPLSQINPASTSVAELYGRLANLAGDLSNTDLKDTGMFKQVTGQDLITAKRKYLRDLFFVNHAKLMFACNELPKVYDLSNGFWSRWILFEFPYEFIKEGFYNKIPADEKHKYKIMDESIIDGLISDDELSGLLNVVLDSLHNIIKNKGFSYSKGTGEVKDLWIRKSDSFTAFCIDKLEEDVNGKVLKKDIRREFSKYCREYKIPGASDMAIKVALENKFGAYDSQGSYGDRLWEGIRLK